MRNNSDSTGEITLNLNYNKIKYDAGLSRQEIKYHYLHF